MGLADSERRRTPVCTAACSKLHLWPAAERGDGPGVHIFVGVLVLPHCFVPFVLCCPLPITDLSCRREVVRVFGFDLCTVCMLNMYLSRLLACLKCGRM